MNLPLFSEDNKIKMNTKHFIISAVIFILAAKGISAQTAVLPQSISYDQALDFSIRNNPDSKIQDLNYNISQEKLSESRLKRAPQIYGKYDLQRNLVIPTTLVPIGRFIPGSTSDDLTPIKFGTNWYSGIGLYGSVRIFDPSVSGDIKEKKSLLAISDIDRQKEKIDILTETGKAYISCILACEQLKYAAEDTVNGRMQFAEISSKYEKGLLKLTDLNQAKLDLNTSISRCSESEKVYNESLKTLLFWMGFSQENSPQFVLTDTLGLLLDKLGKTGDNNTNFEASLTSRRNQLQDQLNRVLLKNTKSGFLPVVSLNGFYSGDYYNNQLHISDGRFWFGNSSVNLSVKIPLTEGIDRTKRISQYKYQIEADKESSVSELNQKSLALQKALDNLAFYRKETTLKKENIILTKSNFETAFALFKNGRLLPSELSNADLTYKKAKIDFLNVIYNYLNTLIELKRIKES